MAVYLTEIPVDLALPPMQHPMPHQFAMGDNNAYTITSLLYDSRTPDMELLDGTVSGELVRPDGETVALTGEKGDEVRVINADQGGMCNATPCSVTLPQACFAYPGRVTLTIKLTDGTTITQALSMSAVVVRTSTDVVVDPGDVVPDIGALQAAAAEALEAADDATDAAADARAAASSAVRYDTAQSLTVAQKAQARGNIAAASLIPDGTAFSQAVQGGTTYDVQDARVEPLDSRVNALHGLVNYGYLGRSPYNGTYAYADGTKVTSKGTFPSNTVPAFIRLSGNDSGARYAGNYADLRAFANPITLIDGHVYRFWMIWESGSVTTSQEHGIYPGVYASGGDLNIGNRVFVWNNSYAEFTYTNTDYPSGVQLCAVYNRIGGMTINNWVANWVLEDVTFAADTNIAPIDTPTATNTHQPGELLTVGGTLYKATQAIAPGDTINSTNVTETTVAAQFAERDTAIAGRAKSGAIAGSLPNNPSVGDLVMNSTGDLYVVSDVDTPNVGDVSLTHTTVAEQLAALAARIAALEANT